jgi:hypothetical protein
MRSSSDRRSWLPHTKLIDDATIGEERPTSIAKHASWGAGSNALNPRINI